MKERPFMFTSVIMGISILIFSQALRILEGPLTRITFEMDHHNFTNSVWLVILTMTTVGYGDIYPRTIGGRIVIFFCSIFGVIIVSIVVVSVTNLLEMSKMETNSYTIIKKLEFKSKMKESAAKVIKQLIRTHLKIKNRKPFDIAKVFELNKNLDVFKKNLRYSDP
jgi:hypothetical protein